RDAVEGVNPWAGDLVEPTGEVPEVRRGETMSHTPNARGLLRVLVADDNRDEADALAGQVKRWGHDVRQAYDGVAALELAWGYQPEVLLLDLAIPRMDGWHLARRL